ncbi:hypothetical protein GO495_28410 [Chitinophaga oryziterrae]|uniref:Uncharacterized protein n=1 Tax=Chitinophaga oryziterrae TaxID=1031224 RepID=A0A6N8JJ96_9BACT|nr:hypothetical protein [Chitinophaga oryziterrae]MVT44551.1 hypothetical protein [Chitinophaga oryziterrae]
MKLELLLPYLLAYVPFGDLLASLSAYIADPDHLFTFTIPLLGCSPQTGTPEVVTPAL